MTSTQSESPIKQSSDAVLTFGDRSFKIADLPEDSQKLIVAIQDCEEQITNSKRRLNYLEIARRSLIQELTSRLPE